MSSLSLRLPDSLHEKIRELAARDDVSINQFIATAVAEKAAALLTVSYLEDRARRADAQVFDRVLARVPDVAPAAGDEVSAERRQPARAQPPRSRPQPSRVAATGRANAEGNAEGNGGTKSARRSASKKGTGRAARR